MAEVGTAFLSIVPSARGFGASLSSQMGPQMDSAGKQAGTRMSAGLKAGLLAGAVVAGAAAAKFIGDSIAEAQASAKISNVTEQLIKNQGAAATVSAAQVGKLSLALSQKTGVDDEAIQSGQNLLLSFQSIQNEAGKGNAIFDRASAAIVDLGTKMGSPEAAAKVLGKALNDPVKGMAALTRAGVPLTKSQQEQVKAFVAAGDTLGAQRVILGAVEQKMGGVAAAQATGAEKMSNAWGNFKEAIGAKLLPVIESVTTALAPLLEKMTSSPAALTAVAIVLGGALVGAFVAAAVAAWAFVAPMIIMALPFILIAIAIAALVAAIVVLVQHWDVVKEKTAAVWDAIKTKLAAVWDGIKSKAAETWENIKTALSDAWDNIKQTVVTKGEAVLQWFKDLPKKLLGYFVGANLWLAQVGIDIVTGLWNGIKDMGSWLKTKIIAWAKENIPAPILSLLGIKSPSKYMAEEVGRWIPAGIAAGIDANAGVVRSSMAALTSDLSVNARVAARTSASVSGASTATDTAGRRYALTITNWQDGTGYFTEVADGYLHSEVFAGMAAS
jgi:hypothetical protein